MPHMPPVPIDPSPEPSPPRLRPSFASNVGSSAAHYDWLHDNECLNPRWAEQEFELRKYAREIQSRLHDEPGGRIDVAISLPDETEIVQTMGGGAYPIKAPRYDTIRFTVTRCGGDEELLLIEECLRRAYNGQGWD